MAWTTPMTAVAGAVFTASNFNTHVRDNLLATAVGLASTAGRIFATTGANTVAERNPSVDFITTAQTTTSTTYVDLTTTGPTVTVTTGTKAIVIIGCNVSNNTAGQGGRAAVAVSGATTSAASDTNSYLIESGNASDGFQGSWVTVYTTLTGGSNTFQLKYRLVGTGTATFGNRLCAIVPF